MTLLSKISRFLSGIRSSSARSPVSAGLGSETGSDGWHDYRAEQDRMTEWLAKQTPLVVDAAARSLNWDFAENVIERIVSNPKTEAATALYLFLSSEPSFYLPSRKADGKLSDFGEVPNVIKAFANNWSEKGYARGSVGFDPREGYDHILDELDEGEAQFRSEGLIPWPELKNIGRPLKGKRSKPVQSYFKKGSEAYFRVHALFEDLGTLLSGMDEDDAQYREWRVANGFGRKPNWEK